MMQQAYRLQVLHAALATRHLEQVLQILQATGVQPFLAKGWVAARYYAEPGVRPPGDIDLYVRPEQLDAAQAALGSSGELDGAVDWHAGCPDLPDRTTDQLYRRSRVMRVGEAEVRVLGPEDHLRLLCLHFFRHGAWRPLWLSDIAAAVEVRPADFDWGYFLSGNRKYSDWVVCAIGLAHQLLGARVADTPVACRARRLPAWLVPAVRIQWGAVYLRYTDSKRLLAYLRRPRGLWRALRQRWPNPVEATVSLSGPFNAWPRLPFQIGDCVVRAIRICTAASIR
jgi:hypothetical protein